MATFLLIIIYFAFIGLGLPDSLFGVAWPAMRLEFGAPIEAAGLVSMLITGCTIVSSFSSGAVLKRLSTGKVTFISSLMTAVAILGFSFAPSFVWLMFLAVPLGLGAGSIDTALNNYVATHYKSHHMSWLHSFWGIGATVGPIILSRFIAGETSWRGGYVFVSVIQFTLVALIFFTLPLWNRTEGRTITQENSEENIGNEPAEAAPRMVKKVKPMQIKGVKLAMVSFIFYSGVETTMGLWGSTFLTNIKGLPISVAAQWVSLYFAGITAGRFINGFITLKVNNRMLIRAGQIITLVGAILLLLPLPAIFSLAAFILIGLGCAPIFPCMLHETPVRFGKENSQAVIGYQMAVAYAGMTFLPPLLGWLAARTTIGILPFFILAYIVVMFISSEKINALMRAKVQ